MPELERQLDLLAQQQGKTRSACIRESIHQDLLHNLKPASDIDQETLTSLTA